MDKSQNNTQNSINKITNRKKYRTLVIDPPWNIYQTGNYGAEKHYDLMSLEQIKNMPIADLVDPDSSHCWLWVTNASLKYAFDILETWGFTYRSIFTWCKLRLGLGRYLRNCTEHILLGTRGKAPVLCNSQMNYGFFPVLEHSHKPEEFHKIVERVSPGPYAELFARRKMPGWDIWGMEAPDGSDFVIPGYPVPKYSAKVTKDMLVGTVTDDAATREED